MRISLDLSFKSGSIVMGHSDFTWFEVTEGVCSDAPQAPETEHKSEREYIAIFKYLRIYDMMITLQLQRQLQCRRCCPKPRMCGGK
jgi:hypothetical protein